MLARALLFVLLLPFLCALAFAQLNGSYTIDSSAPTGGGNYATFQEAANALVAQGVSGPVLFLINPTGGNYAGFSIPGPIAGSSATSGVYFLGSPGPPRVTIGSPAPGAVHGIHLGPASSPSATVLGPSYITIEGIDVQGIPSGTGIIGVGAHFVTIRACRVTNCGSGIGLSATTDSVVEDCEVSGTATTPGIGGSALYAGGIWAYYLSDRNTIQRNRIHDCVANGIFLGSSGSTTLCSNNVVINNFIWNCGTQTSATYAGGISLRREQGGIVANNSVRMPTTSTLPGIFSMTNLVPAEVSNNLVRHEGNGSCFKLELIANAPPVLNHNVYDVAGSGTVGAAGTTLYTTLANWQSATSRETNSLAGNAGFLSATDLHITPASVAFNAGSTVSVVTVDIDGQVRPIAGIPDVGADETQATGLFAAFSATPVSGNVPLTVNFTDASFTTAPGGVATWAWDVNGDGTDDYFTQNPTHTYICPGSFTVTLRITDNVHPTSTLTRTGFITVGDRVFSLTSTGVGDLTINPIPAYCFPGAVRGYTLASLVTSNGPAGSGPMLGLFPDNITIAFIVTPPSVNNIVHFIVSGGSYPNFGTLALPPGTITGLSGASMDAVQVLLNAAGQILNVSNVSRVTF